MPARVVAVLGAPDAPPGLSPRVGPIALGAFIALVAAGLAINGTRRWPVAVAAAVVAVLVATAIVRRRFRTALVPALVAAAGVAVVAWGQSNNVGWFAVCLLAGWCGLMGGLRPAVAFWVAAAVAFGIQAPLDPDFGWLAWTAGTALTGLAAALGRHDRELLAQLREAQADLAERAAAEERNRIARELHDVIAHTLTVALLHVTGARLAVEHDPTEATRSLAEAERLGRESLDEVRRTVGLLRTERGGDGTEPPLPGGGDVGTLVDRFRAAGLEVQFERQGNDPTTLPASVGLAVYRILQEGLTNAAKHAAGTAVSVVLDISAGEVSLAVASAGAPGAGSGLGLTGMRERAELLGGRCVAGPGGPGWLVEATIPLERRSARAPVDRSVDVERA